MVMVHVQYIGNIFERGYQLITPFLKTVLKTEVMPDAGGSNGKVLKDVAEKTELATPDNLPVNLNLLRLAEISSYLAIGVGVYGVRAIMINKNIPEWQKKFFRQGSKVHFLGTVGLVVSSWSRFPFVTGALMAIGTTVFCGSFYYHGLTGHPPDPFTRKFRLYGCILQVTAFALISILAIYNIIESKFL